MLHKDLLHQARDLVAVDVRRPKQANLRRGVSAAYYAIFHALGYAVSRQIVGADPKDKALRALIRRSLEHGEIAEALRGFANANPRRLYREALGSEGVSPKLAQVAATFLELQQLRHRADYDVAYAFSKLSVLLAIRDAQLAIDTIETLLPDHTTEARVFLLAPLLHSSLKRRA